MDKVKLFQDNERLIGYTIRKLKLIGVLDYEELCGMGRIGLWKACLTYDENRGKFSSYAVMWIGWAIKRSMKAYNKEYYNQVELLSLDFPTDGEDEETALVEIVEDPKSDFESMLRYHKLIKKLKEFPLIYQNKILGISQRELAKTTCPSVSRKIKIELKKLKKYLIDNDFDV
jgi:RNA polymerase sigma factor (sigma-70 family)